MKHVSFTVADELRQKFLLEAHNRDKIDLDFSIIHDRPNTNSNVSICVIADDFAEVNLSATAKILPVAKNTNAWLEIKVLTKDHAIVNAAPNLEIANHEVKAGHALTTKHITETELFYLMSRGISRSAAEKLIIDALVAPYRREGKIL